MRMAAWVALLGVCAGAIAAQPLTWSDLAAMADDLAPVQLAHLELQDAALARREEVLAVLPRFTVHADRAIAAGIEPWRPPSVAIGADLTQALPFGAAATLGGSADFLSLTTTAAAPDSWNASFALRVPLEGPGHAFADLHAAVLSQQIAALRAAAARIEALLELSEAFAAVLAAQIERDAHLRLLALARDRRAERAARVAAGQVATVELWRAEAEVDEALLALRRAERQVGSARSALAGHFVDRARVTFIRDAEAVRQPVGDGPAVLSLIEVERRVAQLERDSARSRRQRADAADAPAASATLVVSDTGPGIRSVTLSGGIELGSIPSGRRTRDRRADLAGMSQRIESTARVREVLRRAEQAVLDRQSADSAVLLLGELASRASSHVQLLDEGIALGSIPRSEGADVRVAQVEFERDLALARVERWQAATRVGLLGVARSVSPVP